MFISIHRTVLLVLPRRLKRIIGFPLLRSTNTDRNPAIKTRWIAEQEPCMDVEHFVETLSDVERIADDLTTGL